jgi:hypothetical protein
VVDVGLGAGDGQVVQDRPAVALQGGEQAGGAPLAGGELAAEGGKHVLAGEGGRGRGQPGRAGQPLEHFGHRPLRQALAAFAGPAGHLPDQGVWIGAAFGRLRPPPPVQGVRRLLLLGLAGGMHGPFDQPGCPLPPLGFQPLSPRRISGRA